MQAVKGNVKVMSDDEWEALQLQGLLLLDTVAAAFGVSADDIRGKGRKEEVQHARLVATFLANLVEFWPEDVVGQLIGRSEATVISYSEKANALLEQNTDVRAKALQAWATYRSFALCADS